MRSTTLLAVVVLSAVTASALDIAAMAGKAAGHLNTTHAYLKEHAGHAAGHAEAHVKGIAGEHMSNIADTIAGGHAALADHGHPALRPPPSSRTTQRYCATAKAAFASPAAFKACQIAVFAGGSFLKLRDAFAALDGVARVGIGYTGGFVADPTYEQVCAGKTGHSEAVMVFYDGNATTFQRLLPTLWETYRAETRGANAAFKNVYGAQFKLAVYVQNMKHAADVGESRKAFEANKTEAGEAVATMPRHDVVFGSDRRFFFENRSDADLTGVRDAAQAQTRTDIAEQDAAGVGNAHAARAGVHKRALALIEGMLRKPAAEPTAAPEEHLEDDDAAKKSKKKKVAHDEAEQAAGAEKEKGHDKSKDSVIMTADHEAGEQAGKAAAVKTLPAAGAAKKDAAEDGRAKADEALHKERHPAAHKSDLPGKKEE
jgi:methionine-S-sulfoxide reductase